MSITLKFRDSSKIKEKIAMRGESISDFSKRAKINYSLMTEYLNDKKRPSPPTAKKIAIALNEEIKDIFSI